MIEAILERAEKRLTRSEGIFCPTPHRTCLTKQLGHLQAMHRPKRAAIQYLRHPVTCLIRFNSLGGGLKPETYEIGKEMDPDDICTIIPLQSTLTLSGRASATDGLHPFSLSAGFLHPRRSFPSRLQSILMIGKILPSVESCGIHVPRT